MAINLLKMGVDMEIITQASNFSEAEIKQLIEPEQRLPA